MEKSRFIRKISGNLQLKRIINKDLFNNCYGK